MTFKINKIAFNIFLLLIISCSKTKNDVYNDLKGNWAISKIIYNDLNYKDTIYSMNVINIQEDYNLSLPEVGNYKKDEIAKWGFNYENGLITFTIKSENKIFRGVYSALFLETDTIDKLILKSKNTYLELHKL